MPKELDPDLDELFTMFCAYKNNGLTGIRTMVHAIQDERNREAKRDQYLAEQERQKEG